MTSSSITISNTAPTAPSVSISPDPATAGQDDLVCSVDSPSSDDDGDSVVYTYVWTDDSGTTQQTTTGSSSTSDIFLASGTTEGTWTCEVTPHDMTDDGMSNSALVTVESDCDNTLLGIDGLAISGGNSYSNGTINDMGVVWDTLSNGDVGHISGEESGNHTYNVCFFYDTNGSRTITLDVTAGSTVSGVNYFSSNNAGQFGVLPPTNFGIRLLPSGTQVVQNENLSPGWNVFSFAEYTGVTQVEITFNKQSEHSCVSEIELMLSCDNTDIDGDGLAAWEDCDDTDPSMPNNDADCDGVATADDCDDNDPSIYPDAGDTYDDGVDSDCDGLDCSAWSFGTTYFALCPSNGGVTRANATSACVSAGYDALASIISQAEHDSIKDTIATMPQSAMYGSMGNSYGWAWIGLMGPVLQWDSGLPYTYDGMSAGGDDDGMVYWRLVGYGQHDWGWNDTSDPNEILPFICEKR